MMNYFGNEPTPNQANNISPLAENLLNPESDTPAKVSDLYGAARTKFIQKVYTILAAQLLLTVLMCGLSMGSLNFFKFQMENVMLFYLAFVGAIVTEIWIFCCAGGKKYPLNVILTVIFTLC